MILDIAINGKAEAIVTNNTKDFKAAGKQYGVPVLTPRELLIQRGPDMATEARPKGNPKFPLRLMPSVRRTAEAFSEREGVSLNQFINLAVAEKLAHLEHNEWVHGRKQPTQSLVDEALRVLDKTSGRNVHPGDELPEGYTPVRLNNSKRKHA